MSSNQKNRRRIGVVAPSCGILPALAKDIKDLAAALYPKAPPDIYFHPQAFLSKGHFAGDDASRAEAFLEIANDENFDALWFARGGYGAGRLAEAIAPRLTPAARAKTYMGYSDGGSLLGALYAQGFLALAHGPMPQDLRRPGGEAAVARALAYLVEGAPEGLEPSVRTGVKSAAFNMAILAQLIGTPWQPPLQGHVLMLEEVSEYMYRIDRMLFQITSNPEVRKVSGIRLGRCSDIPPNDPDFGLNEVEVVKYWCERSGIAYLGRADIGHDAQNKIVPFGGGHQRNWPKPHW